MLARATRAIELPMVDLRKTGRVSSSVLKRSMVVDMLSIVCVLDSLRF